MCPARVRAQVVAAVSFASKKTSKTIGICFQSLQGAVALNNTFVLAILMALVYARGLEWEFRSETLALLSAQVGVCVCARERAVKSNGLQPQNAGRTSGPG